MPSSDRGPSPGQDGGENPPPPNPDKDQRGSAMDVVAEVKLTRRRGRGIRRLVSLCGTVTQLVAEYDRRLLGSESDGGGDDGDDDDGGDGDGDEHLTPENKEETRSGDRQPAAKLWFRAEFPHTQSGLQFSKPFFSRVPYVTRNLKTCSASGHNNLQLGDGVSAKITSRARNRSLPRKLSDQAIEFSPETRPLRGVNITLFLNDALTVSMPQKQRKRRSEAQVRHSALLHKSHSDPLTYYVASLEEATDTVEKQRERARLAELDAEHSKKALARERSKVCLLANIDETDDETRLTRLLRFKRS
ncbi:hypothetical protein BJ322DRAFT_1023451 [Thelephora terrestris]|uniref:Uncharacterized protein n=1 Tax=Thelephora terrestris TaxID=56493 RepID=A0A9P6H6R9_9AGAM|nr:hypothetical protein BJ322DRAFT_1023451 [Thelephora terrestris]